VSRAVEVVAERVRVQGASSEAPVVVGIAGAVAVGKSTFAEALRIELETGRAAALRVEVVPTDGFLLPNTVLAERGISMRKGFAESYDTAAMHRLVEAVRRGELPQRVPVYSHQTYDIVDGEGQVVGDMDVVIIEGVNALAALGDLLDVAVYLEADPGDVEAWYLTRFRELRAAAHGDPHSFYGGFAAMSDRDSDAIARQVWQEVNEVNLREHIDPSRVHAHLVVTKSGDHSVRSVTAGDAEGVPRAV
jgi:type I pantothenate kinase